jgi:hypothetical protein
MRVGIAHRGVTLAGPEQSEPASQIRVERASGAELEAIDDLDRLEIVREALLRDASGGFVESGSMEVAISTPEFLCIQYAPFKATSSNFNPF